MAGFDSARLGALDPTAMAGFDSTKFAALDDAAMGGMGSAQLGGMNSAAMTAFDSGKMLALPPAAMSGFKADQMTALPPEAMAGMDSTKIANIPPTAMATFRPTQMGGLPGDAIAGFGAALMTALPPTAMSRMDSAQIGNFTPAAMGAFDGDKIGALPADAFSGFLPAQLEALPPAAFAGFEGDALGKLPLDVMEKMDPTQVALLPKDAVAGMSTAQFDKLPPEALAGMTADNLGGLDPKIMGAMTAEGLANLPAEEFAKMPGQDFAKLLGDMDPAKISAADVAALVPPGWDLDPATGGLTAPPGAGLNFGTLETAPNINGTEMPPLPDLSGGLGLGGTGGGGSVLDGLQSSIGGTDSAFAFEQATDGRLVLNDAAPAGTEPGAAATAAAAFIPDASKMKQAPEGTEAGVAVDPKTGAFVLTTPEGYSIPLLPALADPDAVKNLLPADATITVAEGGQTTFSDIGIPGKTDPVVGIPVPSTTTSDKEAGTYIEGTGADAVIQVVDSNGVLQEIKPAFKDQVETEEALLKIPGVSEIAFQVGGGLKLELDGVAVELAPHFDIQTAPPGEDPFPPGISSEGGKFYTTNKKGERQELSVK
jgi:hypothetical protein